MDGMHRAMGVGPTVFFDGRQCVVRARGLEFDGLVEAEILKRRGDPYASIVDGVKELRDKDGKVDLQAVRVLAEALADTAITRRNVKMEEHIAFLNTPAGEAFEFWYCLRENFPADWTPQRVQWVLQEGHRQAARFNVETLHSWYDWKDGIRRAIDIAGGEDLLGNLTGLRALPATNPVPPRGHSSAPSATDSTSGPENAPQVPEASPKSDG